MGKYGPFKGGEKWTESVPETDLTAAILDEDIKMPILKVLWESKEDVEKVKKMMSTIKMPVQWEKM